MKKSLFGGLFDFDDDGELDEVEKAAELLYLESFDEDNEEDDETDDDFDISEPDDIWEEDDDDCDDDDDDDWDD
jgi:hypothetical protein